MNLFQALKLRFHPRVKLRNKADSRDLSVTPACIGCTARLRSHLVRRRTKRSRPSGDPEDGALSSLRLEEYRLNATAHSSKLGTRS